jgi:phosphoribosyl 1,2-cyclic phosphodiesterase
VIDAGRVVQVGTFDALAAQERLFSKWTRRGTPDEEADSVMRVRFFGVRGSVPWATADSIGHGCNTPCIEVTDEVSGDVLVLDAGSGIAGVAVSLGSSPRAIPILLTHYHWDHVQGLPFFPPFYQHGWTPTIWAPRLRSVDPGWIDSMFQSPFHPVPFGQLPSRPTVTLIDSGTLEIGGFRIGAQPLRHPGGAFAYRIGGPSGDLVYVSDHEFGDPEIDGALSRFSSGAAAIILDAHFTPEELPSHAGWGHATWLQCSEFAAANDIGALWLCHHKPGRTDVAMEAIEAAARGIFAHTTAAREGDQFTI